MEFVILGLLMIRDLSQYEMKRALEQKVSPFFSASLGSIQAALKKLEGNKHVEVNQVVGNRRGKKMYTINDSGRMYFNEWMLSSIVPSRFDQDVTTRLFFLGFMSLPERSAIIKVVITQLEATVNEYEASSTVASQKPLPEQLQLVVKYQLKTLDLGLFYHRNMLEWFNKLLIEIEREGNSSE